MGYACPVCETPQRDAEHLANHLAFTAMLHGDAHESWLDDHAPGWNEEGVDELAPVVAEYATEADYDEVFEESVPEGAARDREDHAHDHQRPSTGAAFDAGGVNTDADTQRALAEAREMTRAMLEGEGEDDGEGDGADADDANASDDTKT
jgi:hypothetical protein